VNNYNIKFIITFNNISAMTTRFIWGGNPKQIYYQPVRQKLLELYMVLYNCCIYWRLKINVTVDIYKNSMGNCIEHTIYYSEWLLHTANSAIFQLKQVNFQWDDDEVHFVLDQYAYLDFYSASWLKQQSVYRHVAPLRHIILILGSFSFVLHA
jgi:hypothetical protein